MNRFEQVLLTNGIRGSGHIENRMTDMNIIGEINGGSRNPGGGHQYTTCAPLDPPMGLVIRISTILSGVSPVVRL